MRHHLYVPENLELDMILEQHEYIHIPAFHKDNLMYILNLIAELPSLYKDRVNEDGYVSINADLLRKWIGRNYLLYLNLLIEAGIIESDNHYQTGKKSIGYKYTSHYNVGVIKKLVTDATLHNKLDEYYLQNPFPREQEVANDSEISVGSVNIAVYEPANKWYRSGLIGIDHELANAYNAAMRDFKLQGDGRSRWDYEITSDGEVKYKNPMMQYRCAQISICKIVAGSYFQHYDDNIFRYHSVITQCKREIRNTITINGQPVIAIDLSNSQPTLLTLVLNHNFWTAAEGFKAADIPYLGIQDMFKTESQFALFIKMCRNAHNNENTRIEIQEFVRLVSTGEFYSAFRLRLQEKLGITIASDKDVKPMLFTVLFTSNHFISHPAAAPKRVFQEWFPTVYDLTKRIKSKAPNNLPILLQRLESYIMFNRIVARIARERPDLPFIPIHDSIAAINGEEGYIEQVMSEELTACLGFTPHFKPDEWLPDKLLAEMATLPA